MPLTNILDQRKNRYRFRKINAVCEATWHDNRCDNADQVDNNGEGPDYDEREHISFSEAVEWANKFSNSVTLYIYDENDGIYPA